MDWDVDRYDRSFGIITAYGEGVVDLLDPQPGERVVDLGCGHGVLTALIAERGAGVVGIDADPVMIERARARYPHLEFVLADAHHFTVDPPAEAVFSNAALHWMTRPEEVLRSVRAALVPAGRFVAEFGTAGNIRTVLAAVRVARAEIGAPVLPTPWYYPTPGQYATLLEGAGFEVRMVLCFDRPTPLDDEGMVGWMRMFGGPLVADLNPAQVDGVVERVAELTRPALFADGRWCCDYRRLRVVAVRADPPEHAGAAAQAQAWSMSSLKPP